MGGGWGLADRDNVTNTFFLFKVFPKKAVCLLNECVPIGLFLVLVFLSLFVVIC